MALRLLVNLSFHQLDILPTDKSLGTTNTLALGVYPDLPPQCIPSLPNAGVMSMKWPVGETTWRHDILHTDFLHDDVHHNNKM